MTNGHLQIRIHGVDGTARNFFYDTPDHIHHILQDLHPARLFSQDKLVIAADEAEIEFPASTLARVDLVSDQLSVWDYPFALGALLELSESEFMEFSREPHPPLRSANSTPVFLKLELAHLQRVFLWMQVIAGLPAARWQKLFAMFQAPRLIFDLRTGGVGVLNLANLVRFSVHPVPPALAADARLFGAVERSDLSLANANSRWQNTVQ